MPDKPQGGITYRFHARISHLVLGPAPDGKPIRFRFTIGGATPDVDLDEPGRGTVRAQRLYRHVWQTGAVTDDIVEIVFEAVWNSPQDPHAEEARRAVSKHAKPLCVLRHAASGGCSG